MAWSRASLSAAQIAKTQADKPIIVGTQRLDGGLLDAKWIQSAETWASADRSAATYELTRLGHRHPSMISFPLLTGPTVTTVRAVFSLNIVEFDCLALLNLSSLGFDHSITVQIADDSTFATNLQTIASWTNVQPHRLASFDLIHFDDPTISVFQRYSSVDWMRVTWTSASNFYGSTPRLGELWLGNRRQMWLTSDVGSFDDFEMDGESSVFEAHDGDRLKYQRFGGRGVRRLTFRPHGAETIDQVAELRGLWKDCSYGAKNVLYCEKPNTVPSRAMAMSFEGDGLAMPIENYRNRTLEAVLMESPPFLASEIATL